MPTVQCFYREQLPHLFTTGPRVIANGRNYPNSHSISYSFAGLGNMLRIRRAGTPAQISAPGTEVVTTLAAPTTALSPIVTPGKTMTWAPSHTFRPIVIGSPSYPCARTGKSGAANR